MRLVEFAHWPAGDRVLVNPDHVVYVIPETDQSRKDGYFTVIHLVSGKSVGVIETMDEVDEMILG